MHIFVGGDVLDAPKTMKFDFVYNSVQTMFCETFGSIKVTKCLWRSAEDVAPYKFVRTSR